MKNLLLLVLLYINDVNAQLRQYQDDGFAGYGSGGAIIVSIIVILVLIFGGTGGRMGILSIFLLFGLPAGLAFLGNNILPTPKIGGELSLAGLIGFFLGLFLWPKLMSLFDKMGSSE